MNRTWCSVYRVECDFLIGRVWLLSAQSEHDARAVVAQQAGVPFGETEAKLV